MKTLSKLFVAFVLLLSLAAAAEQTQETAAAGDVATLRRLTGFDIDPSTAGRALDAVRDARHPSQQQRPDAKERPSSSFLRDVAMTTPSRHPRNLQEGQPSYLFVQMADQCIFQTTEGGNTILKSRHFHGDTIMFSDRPFTYEAAIPTESFFGTFHVDFNVNNGGMPNAAVTLIQNNESQDIVVSTFVKAVVKRGEDDPTGPTYVYKLEQSDEQASVESLSDVLGGEDKVVYDHCSIFIDSVWGSISNGCANGVDPSTGKCANGYCAFIPSDVQDPLKCKDICVRGEKKGNKCTNINLFGGNEGCDGACNPNSFLASIGLPSSCCCLFSDGSNNCANYCEYTDTVNGVYITKCPEGTCDVANKASPKCGGGAVYMQYAVPVF